MYEEIERDMPECEYDQMDDAELATWATDPKARKEINRREAKRQAQEEENNSHKYDDLV